MMLLVLLAAAQPGGIERRDENDLLQFSYSWSARVEARADSGLRDALLRHMARGRAEATAEARRDRRGARAGAPPFNRYLLSYEWVAEGFSVQLDSLSVAVTSYTGGGHADDSHEVLLWDSSERRVVDIAALLGPAAMESLSRRACAEQVALLRRQHALPPEEGEDSACDRLGVRVLAPADTEGNARLDSMRVLVASSRYDIGRYSVEIPFEAADLAQVPGRLRPAFEIRGERMRPLPDE